MKSGATTTVPLERHEQAALVDWLEANRLLFSATAQSTYSTSWNQKRLNHHNGVRKGLPDIIIIIPKDRSADGRGHCLFVEMKRVKGGRLSDEQQIWQAAINGLDESAVSAHVAKGAAAAIDIISRYLKTVDNSPF